MKSEIKVFTSKNLMLQRITDHVVHGYPLYCCGTVSVHRCAKLVQKFDLKYGALADRNLRARRKRNNIGNTSLVLFHNDSDDVIFWWLFVTELEAGENLAHSAETLRDACDKLGRIEIDGYQLVRLPKKGCEGTKFTWRMTAVTYQNWRDSIIHAVRTGSPNTLHNMLYRLWSVPGFAGIRIQVGHLVALYRSEVKRASRKDAPLPPKRLPYVRRLKTQGMTLAQLSRGTKAKISNAHEAGVENHISVVTDI